MKKILFAILTIFTITTQSWGDGFYGKVIDEQGEPISWAYVIFTPNKTTDRYKDLNEKYSEQTDENGSFIIEDTSVVKDGKLSIQILGYKTQEITITDNTSAESPFTVTMVMDKETLEASTTAVVVCTEEKIKQLKKSGATKWEPKLGCIPSECTAPRYKLENKDTTDAKCVDQVDKECKNHGDDFAKAGKYEFDKKTNKLKCVPTECNKDYTLNKKTKKCEVNDCPCGQKKENNKCVKWNENDKKCTEQQLKKLNATSGERTCNDKGEEYCKIKECLGHKHSNLSLYELITTNNECKERTGTCTPTQKIAHATTYKYRKDKSKEYAVFCAVTECEDTYTPNDDGTKCEQSGCTKEDEQKLKEAHASKVKFDKKLNKCIATKCKCGYDLDKENGECGKTSWAWTDGAPPKEPKECDKKPEGAKTAYMDCRGNEEYCHIAECDTGKGYNLAGNQCIQDACNTTEYANALYVKRVDGKCIVQECETGYRVDESENKCVPRDDMLSEEKSQERIKALEANEKAVAENAQTWENKLLGAAGIGGAGAGGQMLAEGLAQKTADEAAERDMTAYMATFKCKYGDNTVDSGNSEIQLPGANDAKYSALLMQYKQLAADLKIRKEALGLKPGIESDEILDGSTLYGRGNTGGADGTYLSLADALSGDADARAEWDEQKKKADTLVGIGASVGVVAIGGTLAGNILVNKNAPKNDADGINAKYDEFRGEFKPNSTAEEETPATQRK